MDIAKNHHAGYEFHNHVHPYIGHINGGIILGEISNIDRFSRPCHLLAFAGQVPLSISQVIFIPVRPECRACSRILRYALVNIAHNSVKNKRPPRTFARRKWLNDKATTIPSENSANQLVCIINKLLTDNIASNLDQQSDHYYKFGHPMGALLRPPFSWEKIIY